MELRMREPNVGGVAPSRLGEDLFPAEEVPACRAGVSRTSFRNCELFMAWRCGVQDVVKDGCDYFELSLSSEPRRERV